MRVPKDLPTLCSTLLMDQCEKIYDSVLGVFTSRTHIHDHAVYHSVVSFTKHKVGPIKGITPHTLCLYLPVVIASTCGPLHYNKSTQSSLYFPLSFTCLGSV